MRIQILILGLQGLNETWHPHCIANTAYTEENQEDLLSALQQTEV